MSFIAIFGTAVGIVSIGLGVSKWFPDQDDHQTVVRIAAGLSTNEADSTSGNMPGIGLYDVMGRKIGSTHGSGWKIKDGDFIDISVPFDDGVGKKPTEYISIANGGNDALCIAYLSLTQPDGTKKAWYGDVAKSCEADWYHSQLKIGDDNHQPACTWIDRNRSNGLRYQGFGLHIDDFGGTWERAKEYNDHRDLPCNAAPRFKMYEKIQSEDPIPFFSPPLEYSENILTDMDPSAVLDKTRWVLPREGPNINKAVVDGDGPKKIRRQEVPQDQVSAQQSRIFANTVIMSKSPNHSAKELCEHPQSKGYDFVSLDEQLFCDMNTRMIWPLCSGDKTARCFDQRNSTMRAGNGLRGRDTDTGLYPQKKTYGKTVLWD